MADTSTSTPAADAAPKGRVVTGIVTRDKMNKTRRVEIQRLVRHPKYGKFVKQRTVCYTHDEANDSPRNVDRVSNPAEPLASRSSIMRRVEGSSLPSQRTISD